MFQTTVPTSGQQIVVGDEIHTYFIKHVYDLLGEDRASVVVFLEELAFPAIVCIVSRVLKLANDASVFVRGMEARGANVDLFHGLSGVQAACIAFSRAFIAHHCSVSC